MDGQTLIDGTANGNGEQVSLDTLIEMARTAADGHLTILKFTTNWRVGLGTIDGREDIAAMAVGRTLGESLRAFIVDYCGRELPMRSVAKAIKLTAGYEVAIR